MELKELFEPIVNFIKNLQNKDKENSKDEAKKRLQLVLMQDRASVSPDFFEMMKKEIIEVIKKYIEIDEEALEVQLTRGCEDGLEGPALYANIPIKNIKPVAKKVEDKKEEESEDVEDDAQNIVEGELSEEDDTPQEVTDVIEEVIENDENNSLESTEEEKTEEKPAENEEKENVSEEVKEEKQKDETSKETESKPKKAKAKTTKAKSTKTK